MRWIKAEPSDFHGTLPRPRSGHTAVNVGKSMAVVFGGLADRKFLTDLCIYDTENELWFTPECTGTESGPGKHVGPSPRAFHVAVAIDCHMFVFGGRYGSKRLGDFWMLDTDTWQWSELTSFGDLPSPRDFAAASAIGNRKIVMHGGSDGKRWLSDVYILDTISLEWMELSISGSVPQPRCGHTATMVEKRLLVFGGRGSGGQIMGDLWALKGLIEEDIELYSQHTLFEELKIHYVCVQDALVADYFSENFVVKMMQKENETPGWTQLKLPGQSPSPCCGHTVTSGGHYLLMFGGHGVGGWLSRYDIYYNDCTVLDRVSVQWKRLPVGNDIPPARAYHSLNSIGSRYLLYGGFDGKSTFGDLWWLVPEDDPIAKRLSPSSANSLGRGTQSSFNDSTSTLLKNNQRKDSPLTELHKRFQIPISPIQTEVAVMEEFEDKELLDLAVQFPGEERTDQAMCLQALRDRWKSSTATSIQLRELGPLLRDYQRLIIQQHIISSLASRSLYPVSEPTGQQHYGFFHVKSSSQLRMDDIPKLLGEYRELTST